MASWQLSHALKYKYKQIQIQIQANKITNIETSKDAYENENTKQTDEQI